MIARYNTDLANNLGNLLSPGRDGAGQEVRRCRHGATRADSPLAAVAAEVVDATSAAWQRVAPSVALDHTWRLLREANALLEEAEPWKAEPGPEVDAVLGDALEVLRIVAILASPAVPRAAQQIWERIGCPGVVADQRVPEDVAWGGYRAGAPVTKGAPLFPRLKAPAT